MKKAWLHWVGPVLVLVVLIVAGVAYRQRLVEWFAGPERTGQLLAPAPAGQGPEEHAPGDIAYYTCPMHPSVRFRVPGTCPICEMDLVPVTYEELRSGVIFVDAQRRQLIGLRTAPAGVRELQKDVAALGLVTYDQGRLTDITLKYRAWIGEQWVDAVGAQVRKGRPLATIYSPELLTAQQEYLDALRESRPRRLLEAARTKLLLWDMTAQQVQDLERRGQPERYVPLVSPVSGTVIERPAVAGSSLEAGARLLRIADLSNLWIEAEVYEGDLPLIKTGQEAFIALSQLPAQRLSGKVSFIYPYVDPKTRRGRVRIEAPNPAGLLKPEMYADVHIHVPLGPRLVVDESAVLPTGSGGVVFIDLGRGKLRPVHVKTGLRAGEWVEIVSGLEAGQRVVTSGNFLVASESKLKSGIEKW